MTATPTTGIDFPDWYYSALEAAVTSLRQDTAPAMQWRAMIAKAPGVKADELASTGVFSWLAGQGGKVRKAEILDYLVNHRVRLKEVVKTLARDTRYQAYAMAGGDDYQEMLVLLEGEADGSQGIINFPNDVAVDDFLMAIDCAGLSDLDYGAVDDDGGFRRQVVFEGLTEADADTFREIAAKHDGLIEFQAGGKSAPIFQSRHWREPNVIFHLRFDVRVDAEGKKVLFIQEIQSDWAQIGKKHGFRAFRAEFPVAVNEQFDWTAVPGFAHLGRAPAWTVTGPDGKEVGTFIDAASANRIIDERVKASGTVPRGPFVMTTDGWLALALKRILHYAAEQGVDRVAFISGEQAANLYDLSKHIDSVIVGNKTSSTVDIKIINNDGNSVMIPVGTNMSEGKTRVSNNDLANVVGKELADKIIDGEPFAIYSGLDLKVGGDGMKVFYDKIVPAALKSALKPLGGELRPLDFGSPEAWSVVNDRTGEVIWSYQQADAKALAENAAASRNRDAAIAGWDTVSAKLVAQPAVIVSQQLGFDMTPALREKVLGRLPLFSIAPAQVSGAFANREALRAHLTEGELGGVVQRLVAAGRIILHDSAVTLPGAARGAQAATLADGTIHLAADRLTPASARPVLLHEAFHSGTEALIGSAAWEGLMDRLRTLQESGKEGSSQDRAFWAQAAGRVAAARAAGPAMSETVATEEFGAYAVEEYASAPSGVRRWVDDLAGTVKAWCLRRFGVQLGAVTPAELHALARAALGSSASPAVRRDQELVMASQAQAFDLSLVGEGNQLRDYQLGDTRISLDARSDHIVLSSVRTPQAKRGKGSARAALQALVAQADREGVTLAGGASPLDGRTRLGPLVRFYQSLGFQLTGRAINPAGDPELVRPAQAPEHVPPTETEAFRRWFGESKVVDAEGKPLVVYHGTFGDFSIFQKSRDIGFHFGTIEQANVIFGRQRNGRNIMPVYLNIKNPLRIQDPRAWPADYTIGKAMPEGILSEEQRSQLLARAELLMDEARAEWRAAREGKPREGKEADAVWREILGRYNSAALAGLRDILEAKGYDGIVYVNRYEGPRSARADSYVAFRPEQIKSALANTGEYSLTNPDIRYSIAAATDANAEEQRTAWEAFDLDLFSEVFLVNLSEGYSRTGNGFAADFLQEFNRPWYIEGSLEKQLVHALAADEKALQALQVAVDVLCDEDPSAAVAAFQAELRRVMASVAPFVEERRQAPDAENEGMAP